MIVATLGRQPALGLAELESLYGTAVSPLGASAALIDVDSIDLTRLGGSTRLCSLLAFIPSTNWQDIVRQIERTLPDLVDQLPEGKIRLGLSYIDATIRPQTLNATGLSLKKTIKAAGRSVRLIPNVASELNTAQVIHNQLTGPTGIELVLITDGRRTALTRTIAVQDIAAYAARDQQRPKRDARVGMLPPKLAQIIVNLATGPVLDPLDVYVMDPFCGTGVIIQEALLMGYFAMGADLDPRMVEYTTANARWLAEQTDYDGTLLNIDVADATSADWIMPFDTVACETYLGRPLAAIPSRDKLMEIMQDCDTIHRKFLQNLARQTRPGFRACLAVPAWKKPGREADPFWHLKTLDSLEKLGYNRQRFVHVRNDDLIYHRPDQIVARELVILQRI